MRALEQINFQKLYLLCKNFAENSCHQMLARGTCFAAKQAFESEYAIEQFAFEIALTVQEDSAPQSGVDLGENHVFP